MIRLVNANPIPVYSCIDNIKYITYQTDVWSLGMTLLHVITGIRPFDHGIQSSHDAFLN